MKALILGVTLWASSAAAGGAFDAQVLFLGEVHDNPAHHARQAQVVAEVQPAAIVWEMLSAGEAAKALPAVIGDEAALGAALGWADSGWPDFAMYYPIFAAAPEARHYGAELPRDEARGIFEAGRQAVAVPNAALGVLLAAELDPEMQAQREALQMAAHCDALPAEMLPQMVDVQRVRDTLLATAALQALEDTGGPVVVITGNGHARTDWGAPALLMAAAPGVSVMALGQGEDGRAGPEGGFDLVESAPPVDRGDPCEAFRKK
jgi:uncharacterized iron-regulated protein